MQITSGDFKFSIIELVIYFYILKKKKKKKTGNNIICVSPSYRMTSLMKTH